MNPKQKTPKHHNEDKENINLTPQSAIKIKNEFPVDDKGNESMKRKMKYPTGKVKTSKCLKRDLKSPSEIFEEPNLEEVDAKSVTSSQEKRPLRLCGQIQSCKMAQIKTAGPQIQENSGSMKKATQRLTMYKDFDSKKPKKVKDDPSMSPIVSIKRLSLDNFILAEDKMTTILTKITNVRDNNSVKSKVLSEPRDDKESKEVEKKETTSYEAFKIHHGIQPVTPKYLNTEKIHDNEYNGTENTMTEVKPLLRKTETVNYFTIVRNGATFNEEEIQSAISKQNCKAIILEPKLERYEKLAFIQEDPATSLQIKAEMLAHRDYLLNETRSDKVGCSSKSSKTKKQRLPVEKEYLKKVIMSQIKREAELENDDEEAMPETRNGFVADLDDEIRPDVKHEEDVAEVPGEARDFERVLDVIKNTVRDTVHECLVKFKIDLVAELGNRK